MRKQKLLLLTILTLLSFNQAIAQQTINVASHSAAINGLQFSYSIGEMTLISTEKNTNLIVTQGFLQPSSAALTETDAPAAGNHPMLQNEVKVYPNPTENILFVESNEIADADISYQLFDASGKIVLSEALSWKAGPNKFSLDLKNFAAGAYYLMVRKPDATGKAVNFSYKIQKTN